MTFAWTTPLFRSTFLQQDDPALALVRDAGLLSQLCHFMSALCQPRTLHHRTHGSAIYCSGRRLPLFQPDLSRELQQTWE